MHSCWRACYKCHSQLEVGDCVGMVVTRVLVWATLSLGSLVPTRPLRGRFGSGVHPGSPVRGGLARRRRRQILSCLSWFAILALICEITGAWAPPTLRRADPSSLGSAQPSSLGVGIAVRRRREPNSNTCRQSSRSFATSTEELRGMLRPKLSKPCLHLLMQMPARLARPAPPK